MQKNFVEELRWRGMLHDIMPETEDHLNQNITSGYIGFDPTADSLHIGSLVQIMILIHFQRSGHRPIALVGGATGMIGDPAGKSDERNLLDAEALQKNVKGIRTNLQHLHNRCCRYLAIHRRLQIALIQSEQSLLKTRCDSSAIYIFYSELSFSNQHYSGVPR